MKAPGLVISAVGEGKRAAMSIDSYLGGRGVIDEELAPVEPPTIWLGLDQDFACQHRYEMSSTPVARRLESFGEITPGYTEESAIEESQRCLQCNLRLKISTVRFWADYSSR